MTEERTLVRKLAHVMTQVSHVPKRGRNQFHKYDYATEADVNDALRDYLAQVHVLMIPTVESHAMREVTTRSGNTEFIVCVDMKFTFIDGESGEEISLQMSGEGQDSGDKAIYKAISGTQKYALLKLFMVPTGDDPEDDSRDAKPPGKQASKTAPEKPNDEKERKARMAALLKFASDHGIGKEVLVAMRDEYSPGEPIPTLVIIERIERELKKIVDDHEKGASE